MDPISDAARSTFRTQAAMYAAAIAGLPDDALHWRPGAETNSLAVFVVHAWGAAQMWTAFAAGQPFPRARATEFRTTATGDELRAVLAAALTRVEDYITLRDPARDGDLCPERPDEHITRAQCLIHALEHTQEHLGQALLTRQLWEQSHAVPTSTEDDDGYRVVPAVP